MLVPAPDPALRRTTPGVPVNVLAPERFLQLLIRNAVQ